MESQLATVSTAVTPAHRKTRGLLRRDAGAQSHLIRHRVSSTARRQVEEFIAREYRRHFAAELGEFMPTLVSLHGADGKLRAAAGYRSAAVESLFLEIYTNAPIEEAIRLQTGVDVPRSEIVEVGSLACTGGRAAMEIVTALVPALIADGFSWVAFTGADTVRNVFRRLNLKPVSLCIANKAMLGERRREWGSYYDHNPVVMAGRIADGVAALGSRAAPGAKAAAR